PDLDPPHRLQDLSRADRYAAVVRQGFRRGAPTALWISFRRGAAAIRVAQDCWKGTLDRRTTPEARRTGAGVERQPRRAQGLFRSGTGLAHSARTPESGSLGGKKRWADDRR